MEEIGVCRVFPRLFVTEYGRHRLVIVIPPPHHEDYPAKGGDVEDSSLTQLHECQRRPIFATLRVVEWRARASVDAEAIRSVQRLLAPWDIRGILRIT